MLAGLGYGGSTIINLLQPQSPVFTKHTDFLIEAFFVAALLLTVAGYAALYSLHRAHAGRFMLVSWATAVAGTTAFALAAAATLMLAREVLGLLFLGGVLAAVIGNIGFGIAILRARRLPPWVGIALMLGLPASMLLDRIGGGMLLGLSWLAIGNVVVTASSTAHLHRGDAG